MEGGVRTLVTLSMTGKQEGMTTDKPKPGHHALTTAPVNQIVITKIELQIELQYCLHWRTSDCLVLDSYSHREAARR